MKLTQSQAARAVGVSRTEIYRALKSGRVSSEKQDDGQILIDGAEVLRVWPQAVLERAHVRGKGAHKRTNGNSQSAPENDTLRELVDVLKHDKATLKEQLDQERDRNDRLMGLLEAAQRKLTGPTPEPQPTPSAPMQPPPRGIWARLTRRV